MLLPVCSKVTVKSKDMASPQTIRKELRHFFKDKESKHSAVLIDIFFSPAVQREILGRCPLLPCVSRGSVRHHAPLNLLYVVCL